MSFLTVPAASLRFVYTLLLPTALALLSSCSHSTQSDPSPAADAAQFADSMGRDYAINSPEFVRGNEYESGHANLYIDHGEDDPGAIDSSGIYTISAEVPAGVNITNALLVYEGSDFSGRSYRRSADCKVGDTVTCRYEDEHIEKASLELDYKVFAPGDHLFTAFIDSDSPDSNPADNVHTMIFRYVASTRYLQSLLDATQPGGSVTLPSGTYMGTLHGGDRALDVSGAEDGNTVLLSDNLEMPLLTNLGNGSSFSNLEFRSSGAPILVRSGYNITLRNSLIAPIQGAWHSMQQLFVNNSYRLLYSRIEGWGVGGECRSLLSTGPRYTDSGSLIDSTEDNASVHESAGYVSTDPYPSNKTQSSVYIQNTVFRDNECTNLLLEYSAKYLSVFAKTPLHDTNPAVFILNNTFVNNKGGIHFPENRDADVQFRNNIFVAHQNQIMLPPAMRQSGEHQFILARNLIWDSDFESLVDPVAAAGPGVSVEIPDISADPLFVDRDGGNYTLATGSPAIDAGAPIEAYFWTHPKGGVSAMQPESVQEPIPVDGLLDGNEIMDIGAFEYMAR